MQRSDVLGLLTGAWMGRWLVLAWSFAVGRRREEGGGGEFLVQLMDCG